MYKTGIPLEGMGDWGGGGGGGGGGDFGGGEVVNTMNNIGR